jgi:hypothetical protein
MHFTYLTLRILHPNLTAFMLPAEMLALLVSSLCHDIDHPGFTNAYEILTGSERAVRHNDLSVLENHHTFITLKVLHTCTHINYAAFRIPEGSIFYESTKMGLQSSRKARLVKTCIEISAQ